MTLDQLLTGLVYLVTVIVLLILGRLAHQLFHRGIDTKAELVDKDNLAYALSVAGYYIGLIMAIGGIMSGPALYWVDDIIAIMQYGLLAIVLLNISVIINDKLILSTFNNRKEIFEDQNAGTGIIEAANYLAVGMTLSGALSGVGGGFDTALAFWLLGQVGLIIGARIYNLILPFDVHAEVEKDNVAVGVAFAGVLFALGNIMRIATEGDFVSWQENVGEFAIFVAIGYILIPILRFVTDKILLPGQRLTQELVNQEVPNIGAGAIEASSYIIASFIIGWIF